MRFVYLSSRFTLHASSPRSVTLTQLRFACLAVASLAGDFHPEDRARAGRTKKTPADAGAFNSGTSVTGYAAAAAFALRLEPARPSSPSPTRAIDAGSGTPVPGCPPPPGAQTPGSVLVQLAAATAYTLK